MVVEPTSRRWRAGAVVLLAAALAVAAGAVLRGRSMSSQPAPRRTAIDVDTVVMLGDSITAQGDWSTLLAGHDVANEGYSGFTTRQLLDPAARVAASRPAIVFVLTGSNDVRDGLPSSTTLADLTALVEMFEDESPETELVIQTLLPRGDKAEPTRRTNAALRDFALEHGLVLLDLFAVFDDGRGSLRDEHTSDGWHLTDKGYLVWADVVERQLDAFGQTR